MKSLGQLVMIGISGLVLTEQEKKFIIENDICGVTLFSRNVQSPKQIRSLCAELQSLRHSTSSKSPLLIAIDMEGGRVARLKEPFTLWPPLKKLGDLDSASLSFHFAQAMGQELKAVGINLNFAPCIDVFSNPENKVIGDRSISTDAEMVAKHGSAIVRGYLKADVIPCVKHFPGHGNTLVDSHEDLPIENATLDRLENFELIPFKKTFKSKAELLMTGHLRFPQIDPDWPVTLSSTFLKKILRENLRYRGLIITDDLDMKALAKYYPKNEIPIKALQAGADILLYCNEPESPPVALQAIEKAMLTGHLDKASVQSRIDAVLAFKNKHLTWSDPPPEEEISQVLSNPRHKMISIAMRDGVIPPELSLENS